MSATNFIRARCPFCGAHLCAEQERGYFSVWCGNGSCPQDVANMGCTGRSIRKALDNFERQVEHLEWKFDTESWRLDKPREA